MIPKKEKVKFVQIKVKVNQKWVKDFEEYCLWLNGDKDLDYFFSQAGRQELDTNSAWKKHKKSLVKNCQEEGLVS